MVVRTSWLGLIGLAVALAQGPPPQEGPRRPFGPPGEGPFAGARFLGAEMGRLGRVVKNAPFSADVVTETAQTLADGNRIKQTSTARVARDSEGRTRREQSLSALGAFAGNGNLPRTVVFIDDPVAGVSYALNPNNKTANKSMRPARPEPGENGGLRAQFRGGPHAGRGRRDNPDLKTESLGTQTMEGLSVQGTRTTMTILAGQMGNEQPIQIVTERWYSPELQTYILVKHSDPRSGETVTRYANISRAEPSSASFQVPADYQVRQGMRGGAMPRNSQ